jgi:hypothetical protein
VTEAVCEAAAGALALAEDGHPLRREGSCYFPETGAEHAAAGEEST